MVEKALSWLNRLPFNLAAWNDLEKLEACRDEYDAQDPGDRHRVSVFFFGEDGLRRLVDSSIAKGVPHDRVAQRVLAIQLIPLAEHRGEQPHSAMHRE